MTLSTRIRSVLLPNSFFCKIPLCEPLRSNIWVYRIRAKESVIQNDNARLSLTFIFALKWNEELKHCWIIDYEQKYGDFGTESMLDLTVKSAGYDSQ